MSRRASRPADARGLLIEILDRIVTETERMRPAGEAEVKRVVYAVYMLGALFNREADAQLARWNLNFYGYGILAALRRAGTHAVLTPTELVTIVGVTAGGISNLLRRLERQGYIARERSVDDLRGVRVRLTPAGRRVADAAMSTLATEESKHLGMLGVAGRRRLYATLRRVISSFEGG